MLGWNVHSCLSLQRNDGFLGFVLLRNQMRHWFFFPTISHKTLSNFFCLADLKWSCVYIWVFGFSGHRVGPVNIVIFFIFWIFPCYFPSSQFYLPPFLKCFWQMFWLLPPIELANVLLASVFHSRSLYLLPNSLSSATSFTYMDDSEWMSQVLKSNVFRGWENSINTWRYNAPSGGDACCLRPLYVAAVEYLRQRFIWFMIQEAGKSKQPGASILTSAPRSYHSTMKKQKRKMYTCRRARHMGWPLSWQPALARTNPVLQELH